MVLFSWSAFPIYVYLFSESRLEFDLHEAIEYVYSSTNFTR